MSSDVSSNCKGKRRLFTEDVVEQMRISNPSHNEIEDGAERSCGRKRGFSNIFFEGKVAVFLENTI